MTDRVEFPQSRCLAGVATSDVTPPVGMYHRMWGAALRDRSTGIHRPLRQTTLVTAPIGTDNVQRDATVFIALDHCLLGRSELNGILDPVSAASGVDRSRIIVFFSHTHAAGLLGEDRYELPGGDLIPAYFEELATRLSESVIASVNSAEPATIVYGTGTCLLATNRDYFDESLQAWVVGFNPDESADSTLLAARIHAQKDGRTLATVVNYACHPTTLAWDNSLISSDYVGAMRELIEDVTESPCFFIQGASGDVGPRDGYVGDPAVADRNGRQLGYAALSVLESMPEPGRSFRYAGPVESGATIGTWEWTDIGDERKDAISRWSARESVLPLTYRSDLPQRDALSDDQQKWTQELQKAVTAGHEDRMAEARTVLERITRKLFLIGPLPDGRTYPYPVRIWRFGDAIWVALDGEHYNVLQTRLRQQFPDTPIIVGTLANGSTVWYLPDEGSYGKDLYQEKVSVLEKGSLETLIDALVESITSLLNPSQRPGVLR